MDAITRKWFDVATVRVRRAPELHGWHSDEELIRLSGAPRDSCLQVKVAQGGRIELRVDNQDLLCEPLVRSVVQVQDGGFVFEIHNKAFVLQPQFRGLGIGPRSVALELFEAQRLGYFSKVLVHAVGDWHHRRGIFAMNGYYVWAQMGFNAPMPQLLADHPDLPAACRDCKNIIDLFSTREGKHFWIRHGTTLNLEFPLGESSASWDRFRRFAEERKIEVME